MKIIGLFFGLVVFSQSDEQVLPMVGELKTVSLATDVDYLFKNEKFILMFKVFLPPEPKLTSDMLPIAPTSSPTIGNTPVGRSFGHRGVT